MIRRAACLLLALALLLTAGGAWAEKGVYKARAALDCSIRREPEAEYRVKYLVPWQEVTVLEYGEEWSRVECEGAVGWMKTRWLCNYQSLDPFHYPVPGAQVMGGAVTLEKAETVKGGKFKGVTAQPGAVICVYGEENGGYRLPVWRGETALPQTSGTYSAFADWETARPGDVIGGFTTYYNETTGQPLPEARAYNIALGCERISSAVVQPGEACSFNSLCGQYYRSGGYQLAVNVSKSGRGYGGGVCQVTTTLLNALLGLPLLVTDWTLHQMTGVQYIPQYFDAAVGNHQDFVFVNTLSYPIRLWADPQGGCVTVLILRAEEP